MNEKENFNQNVNNNGYSSFAPNNYNGPIVVSNAIPEKSGGKAVGSLVCGIISIIGFWSFITIIVAIVGIVLGIINIAQKNPQKGMAIAGIVMSVLGLLLSIGFFFLYVLLAAAGAV